MGKKHSNVILYISCYVLLQVGKKKVCDETSFSSLINERGFLADQSQCRSKKSSIITYFSLLTRNNTTYIQNYIRMFFTHF